MLIKCNNCGKYVVGHTSICPYCHSPMNEKPAKQPSVKDIAAAQAQASYNLITALEEDRQQETPVSIVIDDSSVVDFDVSAPAVQQQGPNHTASLATAPNNQSPTKAEEKTKETAVSDETEVTGHSVEDSVEKDLVAVVSLETETANSAAEAEIKQLEPVIPMVESKSDLLMPQPEKELEEVVVIAPDMKSEKIISETIVTAPGITEQTNSQKVVALIEDANRLPEDIVTATQENWIDEGANMPKPLSVQWVPINDAILTKMEEQHSKTGVSENIVDSIEQKANPAMEPTKEVTVTSVAEKISAPMPIDLSVDISPQDISEAHQFAVKQALGALGQQESAAKVKQKSTRSPYITSGAELLETLKSTTPLDLPLPTTFIGKTASFPTSGKIVQGVVTDDGSERVSVEIERRSQKLAVHSPFRHSSDR